MPLHIFKPLHILGYCRSSAIALNISALILFLAWSHKPHGLQTTPLYYPTAGHATLMLTFLFLNVAILILLSGFNGKLEQRDRKDCRIRDCCDIRIWYSSIPWQHPIHSTSFEQHFSDSSKCNNSGIQYRNYERPGAYNKHNLHYIPISDSEEDWAYRQAWRKR